MHKTLRIQISQIHWLQHHSTDEHHGTDQSTCTPHHDTNQSHTVMMPYKTDQLQILWSNVLQTSNTTYDATYHKAVIQTVTKPLEVCVGVFSYIEASHIFHFPDTPEIK